jgi:hypothetical protein
MKIFKNNISKIPNNVKQLNGAKIRKKNGKKSKINIVMHFKGKIKFLKIKIVKILINAKINN